MQSMAFIIRATAPTMGEKYGFGRRYGNSVTVGDGCDGIFDSGGGSEITVTTVTYRHGEDGIR